MLMFRTPAKGRNHIDSLPQLPVVINNCGFLLHHFNYPTLRIFLKLIR